MASRGQKPQLRLVAGLNPVPAGDADPPYWLTSEESLDEWGRITSLLRDVGALCELDLTALAHYCHLHGEIVRKVIAGVQISTADRRELRTAANELLLTGSSRLRAAPKDENPFNGLVKT